MTETRAQEQKRIEDTLRQHSQAIAQQSTDITQIKDMLKALCVKCDQMKPSHLPSDDDAAESNPPDKGKGSFNSSHSVQTRIAKIDFPHFSGDDPSGWIYKCERFFEFNSIDEEHKIKLAVMHLDDRAIQWFQWYEKAQKPATWKDFVYGLRMRFGLNAFEDATGELSKLTQTTTVRAYQERFEELANRTTGLTEEFYVSCFFEWSEGRYQGCGTDVPTNQHLSRHGIGSIAGGEF